MTFIEYEYVVIGKYHFIVIYVYCTLFKKTRFYQWNITIDLQHKKEHVSEVNTTYSVDGNFQVGQMD